MCYDVMRTVYVDDDQSSECDSRHFTEFSSNHGDNSVDTSCALFVVTVQGTVLYRLQQKPSRYTAEILGFTGMRLNNHCFKS